MDSKTSFSEITEQEMEEQEMDWRLIDSQKSVNFGYHYNKIEDQLYLGDFDAVVDLQTMKKLKIKRVLTITTEQIHENSRSEEIDYKFIYAEDEDDYDLLSHFPEAVQHISDGQKSGQNVFVHCMAGISRSATIVLAFIMNKYKKPFLETYKLVQKKRGIIRPNDGFAKQLLLYEGMNYGLNANNRKFRQFLVSSRFLKFSSNKYFEMLSKAEKLTDSLALGPAYCCVKCDKILFNEIHIIKNNNRNFWEKPCNSVYIEPQKWMIELFEKNNSPDIDESHVDRCNCPKLALEFKPCFTSYHCDCVLHSGINCLKFKLRDKSFKAETKYCNVL